MNEAQTLDERFAAQRARVALLTDYELGEKVRTGAADVYELSEAGRRLVTHGSAPVPHYHVAYGIAGYGPDGADGYASFDDLAGALEYASDYLRESADMLEDEAEAEAENGRYEDAWNAHKHADRLELQRMNQDLERRRSAPLYVDDDEAYAALLEDLAGAYPIDVDSRSCRLYLWDCDAEDCDHWETEA